MSKGECAQAVAYLNDVVVSALKVVYKQTDLYFSKKIYLLLYLE